MKLGEITRVLEQHAPLILQESYDNSGLLVGSPEDEVLSALICVDLTEEVIEEAIADNIHLIITHHPLIFRGLKKVGKHHFVERILRSCIKHDISVYAIHTNLDNISTGVNHMICDKIGLKKCSVLSPRNQLLKKLVTFCPHSHAQQVREALFAAGAGTIGNYDSCSFNVAGEGTFRALEGANPFVGNLNQLHFEPEVRIEVIFPVFKQNEIIRALLDAHPYEEVAYDIYPLDNLLSYTGSGMIGYLEEPEPAITFLKRIKAIFQSACIRHSRLIHETVRVVAVCGGSGSFLIPSAIAAGAQVFVTGDVKYHDFFETGNQIIIADIGHYESEQFTAELILKILKEKFPNFAARITGINTNPVHYL